LLIQNISKNQNMVKRIKEREFLVFLFNLIIIRHLSFKFSFKKYEYLKCRPLLPAWHVQADSQPKLKLPTG
jgi:hypothetical protein